MSAMRDIVKKLAEMEARAVTKRASARQAKHGARQLPVQAKKDPEGAGATRPEMEATGLNLDGNPTDRPSLRGREREAGETRESRDPPTDTDALRDREASQKAIRRGTPPHRMPETDLRGETRSPLDLLFPGRGPDSDRKRGPRRRDARRDGVKFQAPSSSRWIPNLTSPVLGRSDGFPSRDRLGLPRFGIDGDAADHRVSAAQSEKIGRDVLRPDSRPPPESMVPGWDILAAAGSKPRPVEEPDVSEWDKFASIANTSTSGGRKTFSAPAPSSSDAGSSEWDKFASLGGPGPSTRKKSPKARRRAAAMTRAPEVKRTEDGRFDWNANAEGAGGGLGEPESSGGAEWKAKKRNGRSAGGRGRGRDREWEW